VIEVGRWCTWWFEFGARFDSVFVRALAIIPPHQQLFHEALFNKFELPGFFSQKNNGRVISMALMPTSIGIRLLHDWDFS
jgi:hypothetical protein